MIPVISALFILNSSIDKILNENEGIRAVETKFWSRLKERNDQLSKVYGIWGFMGFIWAALTIDVFEFMKKQSAQRIDYHLPLHREAIHFGLK